MGFQTPWRTYHPGDVFYGLAGSDGQGPSVGRNIVIDKFVAEGTLDLAGVYTIDQYGLFAEFDNPGYSRSPLLHDPDFIAALQGGAKTAGIVGTDLNDNAAWNNDPTRMGAIAKRKCKAGLDYIINQTTKHVHFCLQSLNLDQIATKAYLSRDGVTLKDSQVFARDGAQWDAKKRFITGCELRWIYRHRGDAAVQERVQFWKRNPPVQCPPPWDDRSEDDVMRACWLAYRPGQPPENVGDALVRIWNGGV